MPFRDTLAELVVPIYGDAAPLYKTIGSVKSALPSLLGLGGIAAGGLGLGFAAKTAIGFESALAKLSKAANLSGSDVAGFRDQLEALSVRLKTVPLNQLYEIATTGAKLGIARDDLLAYTEGIVKVSAAMDDIPAGRIADEIGKINIVFRLGVVGTQQLGSAIGKLADSGASYASQILNVTQRISGLASASKLTAPQTVALAAALLDTGTEAEAAAGSLSKLIASMSNAKKQAGFAQILGVSVGNFAKQVRDQPIQAIQAFLTALGKLDAAGQQAALGLIGITGVREAPNIQKLAVQADTLARYVGLASNEFATLNQLTRGFGIESGLTKTSITGLWNQVQISARVIGDEMNPAIRSITDGLSTVTSRIPEIVAAFRDLGSGDWAEGIRTAVSVNLGGIGGIIDGIIPVIRNLDLIFQETGTRIGIGAVNIGEAFGGLVRQIGAYFSYAGQIIESWGETAYNAFVRLYNRALPVFDALLRPINDLGKTLGLQPGGGGGGPAFAPLKEIPVTQPKLAEIKVNFTNVDDFLGPIRAAMQARADREAERKAAAVVPPAAAAAAKPGAAVAAVPGALAPAAATVPTGAGQFVGLQEFFNNLQRGALSANNPAERTAKNTEKMVGGINELVQVARNPKVNAVPAVVGPM